MHIYSISRKSDIASSDIYTLLHSVPSDLIYRGNVALRASILYAIGIQEYFYHSHFSDHVLVSCNIYTKPRATLHPPLTLNLSSRPVAPLCASVPLDLHVFRYLAQLNVLLSNWGKPRHRSLVCSFNVIRVHDIHDNNPMQLAWPRTGRR
jgi:hypothetical protein